MNKRIYEINVDAKDPAWLREVARDIRLHREVVIEEAARRGVTPELFYLVVEVVNK